MRSPSASRVAAIYESLGMHTDPPDSESYMSVQALQAMRDHASELLGKVGPNTALPDWVEAKLTEASSKLTDVYEYMSHGHGQNEMA